MTVFTRDSRITTRVIVAHDAGARSFEHHGPGKTLVSLRDIAFEDGRRHVGDLEEGGRGFDRSGSSRHAYEAHQDTRQHAVAHFAKVLAQDLARDFHLGEFQQLVLVAPPRFLGVLREALDGKLLRAVIGSVAKDLPRCTPRELAGHLKPFVSVAS
jgi:protein required for attachment to host cells